MNKYNEKINYLLENFTFQQLSTEDKKLVLDNISESEYEMYNKIVSNSQAGIKETLPSLPSHMKATLTKDFNNKFRTQKTSYLKNGLAAVALLCFGAILGYTLGQRNIPIERNEAEIIQTPLIQLDTVYIHKVDTLIHEVKAEPQVIIKEVFKTVSRPIANSVSNETNIAIAEVPSLNQKNRFTNIELDDLKFKKLGISVREDSDLMNFLEVMPSDGLE